MSRPISGRHKLDGASAAMSCCVISLIVEQGGATLVVDNDTRPDMTRCITYFRNIDPELWHVTILCDDRIVLVYVRQPDSGGWLAAKHNDGGVQVGRLVMVPDRPMGGNA